MDDPCRRQGRDCYLCFSDKEMEIQGGEVTSPRPLNGEGGSVNLSICLLSTYSVLTKQCVGTRDTETHSLS